MEKITIYTKEKVYNFISIKDKNYSYALDHAHKEDGPAIINYNNNKIVNKIWYLNGKRHRKNGPAYISYYKNSNIQRKAWFLNDKLHNENGPAYISYYKNGNIEHKEYYINERIYLKTKFNQEILKKKLELI